MASHRMEEEVGYVCVTCRHIGSSLPMPKPSVPLAVRARCNLCGEIGTAMSGRKDDVPYRVELFGGFRRAWTHAVRCGRMCEHHLL